jgi:hypothetical protein
MKEWKSGTLKDRGGNPITNQQQAVAVALSEQRRMDQGKQQNTQKSGNKKSKKKSRGK